MAASADLARVTGAVLCGGASRRMGQDKATMVVGTDPLVARAVDALRDARVEDIRLIGGDAHALAIDGCVHVPDDHPGAGPLGGIVTALRCADRDTTCVVVLACDLLRPPASAITALVEVIDGGADVAVPVVDGRRQWLFSAWSTRTLGRLEQAFDAGIRAPRRVEGLHVVDVAGLDSDVAVDADVPADLDHA